MILPDVPSPARCSLTSPLPFRPMPSLLSQPAEPHLMPVDWLNQEVAYMDPDHKAMLRIQSGEDLGRRIKSLAVQVGTGRNARVEARLLLLEN